MSWADDFTRYTTGFAFNLTLSRDQTSLLEAIGNDASGAVHGWAGASGRGVFIPVVKALIRRGLVEHNPACSIVGQSAMGIKIKWYYRLTPAGRHVLELLRLSGVAGAASVAVEEVA